MEKRFKREIDELDKIFEFVDGFISNKGFGDDIAFSTRLAVEELFTNLVRHNIGGRDHITISLKKEPRRLVLQLRDFDVDPFDIPNDWKVDVHKPLDERMVGGLGIHLVRSVVDKLTYEYKNRTLHITAIKKLEEKDV